MSSRIAAETLGGVGAGLASKTLLYPIDVVGTRVQAAHVARRAEGKGEGEGEGEGEGGTGRVTAWTVASGLWREQGPRGFYHGLGAKVLEALVEDSAFFFTSSLLHGVAERASRARGARPGKSRASLRTGMAVNAAAGLVCQACCSPLTVTLTRMQTSAPADRLGVLETLLAVVRQDGVAGLFAGIAPSALLVVNPAINYALFDNAKARVLAIMARASALGGKRPALSPLGALLLGVLSKSIATLVTFPLIRLKVLVQTSSHGGADDAGDDVGGDRASGRGGLGGDVSRARRLFFRLIAEEGLGGMYRGLFLQLAKSALGAALLFATRERIVAAVSKLLSPRWRAAQAGRVLAPPPARH